jgi:phospholipase/carboxylesterase
MIRKLAYAGIPIVILLSGLGIKSCMARTISVSHPVEGRDKLKVQIVTQMAPSQKGGMAVVLLHGWGAPGDDLVPLAHRLLTPDMRIFVPEAPLPHLAGGRAWWPLDLGAIPHANGNETQLPTEIPVELARARTAVQRLLKEIKSDYTPASLTLAGFSQGGMLTADVALINDPPLDRAAVLSGSLLPHSVAAMRASRDHKPDFFISHGSSDRIVPFTYGRELKDALQNQRFHVAWHPFPGDHEIPTSVIQALKVFLRAK